MTRRSNPFTVAACALAATWLVAACGGGEATAPDTLAPAVVITSSVGAGSTATGDVTFTFAFSEDVGTSFTAEDIVVSGGTAGAFTRVSGTQATLVVTPSAATAGQISVSVSAAKFNDASNNANTTAASASQAYDTTTAVARLVNFEEAIAPVLIGFGGAEDASIVTDPVSGTGKVAKVIKADGAQTWAGTTVATGANQSIATIPFTTTSKTLTLRVWSPDAGIPVRLKVENAGDPTKTVETEATTTVAGGWQTLSFDFANPATGTAAMDLTNAYNKASVFFAFGSAGTGKTYYFDDLTFVASATSGGGDTGGGTGGAAVTFDESTPPVITGFGGLEGANASIAADPALASNKVARLIKPADAQTWGGATFVKGTTVPLSSTAKSLTLRVYSPYAGVPIMLKVENADGSKLMEAQATVNAASTWQTLTFTYNPEAGVTYNTVSVFPNFGNTGAGAAGTYYVDDLVMPTAAAGGGGTGAVGTMSYIVQPFTENVQSAYDQATGKAQSGQYATGFYAAPGMTWWWGGNYKAKIQSGYGVSKSDAGQSYFGSYIVNGASGWDIASATTYAFRLGTNGECAGKCAATVRLVSVSNPNCVADIRVPLIAAAITSYTAKLADFTVTGCATNTVAAFKQAKVAELHFQMLRADMQFTTTADAGGLYPNGLDMADSIGFDAPTGAPAPVADAVVVAPATFPPLTFDDPAVTYLNTDFGGTASAIVAGPLAGDGKVLKISKLAGAEVWAGTTMSTGPNFSISKIPFSENAKKMTLRVWSPAVGTRIRLKVEDASDVTHTAETDALTTVAGAWETLTFDFGNPATNNGNPTSPLFLTSSFTKASVFPAYGTAGAVTGDFYFDDLTFVSP